MTEQLVAIYARVSSEQQAEAQTIASQGHSFGAGPRARVTPPGAHQPGSEWPLEMR